MALTRRTGQRFQASIWPGFVDAMTGLLLVLMFVLTIFTVMQFVLSDILTGKDSQLSKLSDELTALASTLGAERLRNQELSLELDTVNSALQSAEATLAAQREQVTRLVAVQSDLEERLAQILVEKAALEDRETLLVGENAALSDEVAGLLEDKEALEAAQAAAAAALIKSKAENAQVAATAEELRKRLEDSDAEISILALNLENARAEAEDTLTLLAAAQAKEEDLNAKLAAALAQSTATQDITDELRNAIAALEADNTDLRDQMAAALIAQRAAESEAAGQFSKAEERAILLAQAKKNLSEVEARSAKSERELAALNVQVATLNSQLAQLQSLFDAAKADDSTKDVRIEALGKELNVALAKLASEQKKRLALEEAERRRAEEDAARLAEEAQDLAKYRSEFFGRLREVLANEDSIQIRGDRFVFSSEVLFDQGSATLSAQGEAEVAKVARILRRISQEIPATIPWIIRVDGHTDNVPLSGTGEFADNWELSQARALSVVRYLSDRQNIEQRRLAANGFGEFQPVAAGNSEAARALNRRIELKLTER